MRAVLLTAVLLIAAPLAAADLLDQEAVFARARELAVAEAGVADADLLLRSTRSVVPAADVIAAAEPEAVARLKALLRGSKSAWHYQTVRVRFRSAGDPQADVQLTTTLLNEDPEKGEKQ